MKRTAFGIFMVLVTFILLGTSAYAADDKYDTGITYEQLINEPNTFKGSYMKFTGTVYQVVEDTEDSIVGIFLVDGLEQKAIYFGYEKEAPDIFLLEGDEITVLGGSIGMWTYENIENEDVTIPGMYVEKIEFMDKGSVKEPVTGVEVTKKNPPISNFSYHIYDDTVVLERYKGNDEIVDIFPTYEIDSVTYKTDLSEFMIGIFNNTAKTVIFEEGITEVYDPVFNSCDVQSVYFPLSMELVYDNTLSYLSPETGRIKIYYAGTQEQWANIFTEYTRTLVSEAEFGGEMGTALGDAINDKFGSSYDSSEFVYYFESSPDDLR